MNKTHSALMPTPSVIKDIRKAVDQWDQMIIHLLSQCKNTEEAEAASPTVVELLKARIALIETYQWQWLEVETS